MTNCPNCGAVVNLKSNKCEYCGTPYEDVTIETLYADNTPILQVTSKAYTAGILTANEARELLRLERLRDQQTTEKLYSEAIKTMRCYSGE